MILAVLLPESDPEDQPLKPAKTWILVLSSALVLASFVIYTWIFIAGLSFSELYAGFGGDMPTLSKLTFALDQYAFVLGFIGLIPLIALFRSRALGSANSSKYLKWIIGSFGLSLFVTSIWVVGAYLPIFKMGSVVSLASVRIAGIV